jgi:hypothetical protein
METPSIPTAQERRLIAALAVMSEKQVLKAYQNPERRRPATLERIRQAATQLGLPTPSEAA